MNHGDWASALVGMSACPAGTPAFEKWISFEGTKAAIVESGTRESVVCYASTNDLYLNSVFVRAEYLAGDLEEPLLNWNMSPSSGWSIGYDGDELKLFEPQESDSNAVLKDPEPIVFLRYLEGHGSSYLEPNQRFIQANGLHFIPERDAWSQFDDNGDWKDSFKITNDGTNMVCTVDKENLDRYMVVTQTVMIRLFDCTRFEDSTDCMLDNREDDRDISKRVGFYARRYQLRNKKGELRAGALRGAHVVRPALSKGDVLAMFNGTYKKREYASFLGHDWKHKKVCEMSCDPGKLGNYFVKSELPYETSPVFFRGEVLTKYKGDPDKYAITEWDIHCRGAWGLQRYHVNDAGQVFTYIVYLGQLPHNEQLYWKSFNEAPKGGISKRAFTTDFEGQFWTENDPIESLQELLSDFPSPLYDGKPIPIWAPPPQGLEKAFRAIHYVTTDSVKEWKDETLELAKLLVDQLQVANIRKIAKALECDDEKLGSIKLLGACLRKKGVDAKIVDAIVGGFGRLFGDRSGKGVAHGGGAAPKGDLKKRFEDTLKSVQDAVGLLRKLVEEGVLTVALPKKK